MISPEHVVVAGDWHSNERWAVSVTKLLPELLPDEELRIILSAGDHGYWPSWSSGRRYIDALDEALEETRAQLWFIDGNHEEHSALESTMVLDNPWGTSPRQVSKRTFWLPRGYRWQWYGRTWLALGGAVSVDRELRTIGVDWFPEEEITQEQAEAISSQGHADVVLSHDCPIGVPLNLPRPAPRAWQPAIPDAERHRELVARIGETVTPAYWMHGHYHLSHRSLVQMPWGEVDVTGLSCDGMLTGNYRVLGVEEMQWIR